MTHITKIYGAPGTGKTTRLLEILDEEVSSGVDPSKIAYISHTTAAIEEAKSRVKVDPKALIYFKTIHAICFFEVGLSRDMVVQPKDYVAFGRSIGIQFASGFSGELDVDGLPFGYSSSSGNGILNALNFARSNMVDITEAKDIWPTNMHPDMFLDTIRQYIEFKAREGMVDFTDMLEMYIRHCHSLPLEVLIVDEAQDLSKLQWEVVRKMWGASERIYIAGDDDQSIYTFIGADSHGFLNQQSDTIEILPYSYRLKSNVWNFAKKIIGQVKLRQEKNIEVSKDDGKISWTSSSFNYKLINSNVDTMIITRHNAMLIELSAFLELHGVPYIGLRRNFTTGSHIEAVKAYFNLKKGNKVSVRSAAFIPELRGEKEILKRMRDAMRDDPTFMVDRKTIQSEFGVEIQDGFVSYLSKTHTHRKKNLIIKNILENKGVRGIEDVPNIYLTTYHGSKGREARRVILYTDCFRSAWENQNKDDEHRLSYVGVTRAIDELTIVNPRTSMYMRSLLQ